MAQMNYESAVKKLLLRDWVTDGDYWWCKRHPNPITGDRYLFTFSQACKAENLEVDEAVKR